MTFIDAQMSPVNACLRPHLSPYSPHLSLKRPHLSPKMQQYTVFIDVFSPELIELVEQEGAARFLVKIWDDFSADGTVAPSRVT